MQRKKLECDFKAPGPDDGSNASSVVRMNTHGLPFRILSMISRNLLFPVNEFRLVFEVDCGDVLAARCDNYERRRRLLAAYVE